LHIFKSPLFSHALSLFSGINAGSPPVARARAFTRSFSKLPSNESFISGSSINYVEAMHSAWLKDPKSVHVSWQAYFFALESGKTGPIASLPPTLQGGVSQQVAVFLLELLSSFVDLSVTDGRLQPMARTQMRSTI
jgi:2-oxoglutarate dehydrogenase complex dehydrogenase (E1) component-like enzyme